MVEEPTKPSVFSCAVWLAQITFKTHTHTHISLHEKQGLAQRTHILPSIRRVRKRYMRVYHVYGYRVDIRSVWGRNIRMHSIYSYQRVEFSHSSSKYIQNSIHLAAAVEYPSSLIAMTRSGTGVWWRYPLPIVGDLSWTMFKEYLPREPAQNRCIRTMFLLFVLNTEGFK